VEKYVFVLLIVAFVLLLKFVEFWIIESTILLVTLNIGLATILKYLCFRKYFKVVIKNNGKAIIGFQLASQSMHVAWFHSCNTIPR